MSQFSVLYGEVLRRSITDVTAQASTATQAKLFVNNAQRQVKMIRRWNCLYRKTTFNTTAALASYTLSARSTPGLLWHEEFGYPSEIVLVTDRDWVGSGIDTATTGKPSLYHVVSQSVSSQVNSQAIKIWPIPDGTYTINDSYYADVTDMVADIDTPTFPREFDEILIGIATYGMLKGRHEYDGLPIMLNDNRLMLADLLKWDDKLVPDKAVLHNRVHGTRNAPITDSLRFPIP